MASRPIMLLGNLASILLSIIGLLQYVSWTVSGTLILAILSITTLLPTTSPIFRSSDRSANRRSAAHSAAETRISRERTLDKPVVRPHQTGPRPEPRPATKNDVARAISQTRTEFQKTMAPKITPPKTIPATVSPSRPGPTRPSNPRQDALKPIPPQIQSSVQSAIKSTISKADPNTKIIGRGDYGTYDMQLDKGFEVKCDVSASSPVNVYILNQENLTGLDLGEEFWSETGEEDVTKTTLTFVAPESGEWFLVVENTDNNEVSATVNIKRSVTRTSQKTEK